MPTHSSNRQPVLLVHGGAWAIPDDMVEAHQLGVSNALAIGYAILEEGGTAVDAVEAAVTILEDDRDLRCRPRQLPHLARAASSSTPSSWTAPRFAPAE